MVFGSIHFDRPAGRPLKTYTVTLTNKDYPVTVDASCFKIIGEFIQFIDESDLVEGAKLVIAYNAAYVVSVT